jgi:hypothetical protein
VQQQVLDQNRRTPPPAQSFDLPAGLDTQQRAIECARRAQLDVTTFVGCTGQQIILPENELEVLECAMSTDSAQKFANCSAGPLGITLSKDQRVVIDCAHSSNGDRDKFVSCAGSFLASKGLSHDQTAVLHCATKSSDDASAFADCSARYLLGQNVGERQMEALKCLAETKGDRAAMATCAVDGTNLNANERTLAACAMSSSGDGGDFLSCAGSQWLNRNLDPDQKAVLHCATEASDTSEFASCSAVGLLGNHATPEQKVALKCAAQSQGDATGFATCAGANMFNLQLNPEQQIAVQCVVSTGGQPYAAAGCMATRLTARELVKCVTNGFGGADGCFGDNNDIVGKNGWTAKTLNGLLGGSNSFARNPSQIWGGDNSFVRNPSQIWGGNNSFVRNPSQVWGGNNSVFNNPGQLAPPPATLGSIGGKRICLPWC